MGSNITETQLKVGKVVELTYFGLHVKALAPMLLMELSSLEYKAVKVDFKDWGTMKPTTPTGCLPVATLEDGFKLVESSAILRACAADAGLLGVGKDYLVSEMLLGLSNDLEKIVVGNVPTVMTLADWTPDKTEKAKNDVLPKALAHLAKYEQFLTDTKDRFTASGIVAGEVDFFARLFCYSASLPELKNGALKPFYDRLAATDAAQKVFANKTPFGEMAMYFQPLP